MVTTQVEDFSEDNVPQSNWFKFDEVGNSIIGTLVSKNFKKWDDRFKDQQVYKLIRCTVNGVVSEYTDEEISVGIAITSSDYVNVRMAKVIIGQRIGFKFVKEIPSSKKGYKPAKSIMPNIWGIDPLFKKEEEFSEINVEDIPF